MNEEIKIGEGIKVVVYPGQVSIINMKGEYIFNNDIKIYKKEKTLIVVDEDDMIAAITEKKMRLFNRIY